MAFQIEYEFNLPKGYIDRDGTLQKRGTMRLATAADEVLTTKDPRVQQNPSYLTVVLLSQVITRLGSLPVVDTKVIENLFTADLNFLQDMYQKINAADELSYSGVCPHCGEKIKIPINFMDVDD